MQDLKITIIQSPLYWEDIDRNLEMFDKKISLINEPTDLIVLPEMFNTSFTMNVKAVAEKMGEKTMQWMLQKAKEKQCVLTGSLIINEDGHYYNRLLWVNPDGTYQHYDKRHLFRMANEHHYFSAGTQRIITPLKGWRICPLICYDLRFPVWSRNANEYDCLLYVANWPEQRSHPWKILLQARAIENQCYVIGVNRIGKDGKEVSFSGDSAVINAKGEIISNTKMNEEATETTSLSFSELEAFRAAFPVSLDSDKFEIIN